VLSPVVDLTASQTDDIPVKCLSHSIKNNSVCFMPTEDIEDDKTSHNTYWVNAHGVALKSSSPNELEYRRGDRLWISIDNESLEDSDNAPVINLRTMEQGIICIGGVCWFPEIEGPDGELWTLGGPVRALKQAGPRNFIYFSWVICQRLDDCVTTIKKVQIPTSEMDLPGRRLLSAKESTAFFERQCRAFEEKRPQDLVDPLPSPPMTPARQCDVALAKMARCGEESPATSSEISDFDMWGRIIDMAVYSPSTQINFRETTVDPEEKKLFQHEVSETSSSVMSWVAEDDQGSIASSTSFERSSSPDGEADWVTYDSEVYITAIRLRLLAQGHPQRIERQEVVASTDTRTDPSSKMLLNPTEMVVLYDLRDPRCKEITTATCKHYHPLPSKCVLNNRPSELGVPSLPHEHCISRLRPLPDKAGPCILADIPSRRHVCCIWEPQDWEGWDDVCKEDYEKSDAEKLRRFLDQAHMTYYDKSHLVNYKPGWEDIQTTEWLVELASPAPNLRGSYSESDLVADSKKDQ
jgi:hypothetical protein